MIELNLLPEELKKKRKKIELPEIPIVPIVLGLVGILIIIQLFLGGLAFFFNRQLSVLEKHQQDLLPKKAELDELKEKISTLSKKIQAIEGLIEKRLSWSRLLNELSNSLTANVWLTELSYDEKVDNSKIEHVEVQDVKKRRSISKTKTKSRKLRNLNLLGSASGIGEEATTYVARFIKSLKDNEMFFKDLEDVELVSIKKGFVAERDVMNFTLVCHFKPEEVGE